jgi:catechol 2,3-dioxygenase-like lactoylglutathione lyase family enzyme
MKRTGIHHLGLATLDIDKTIDFWTNKLACEVVLYDLIDPPGGGKIKHVFMDTGDGSFVAFMCPENVPTLPAEWTPDINAAQGLPGAVYHFAFWADDLPALEAKRAELLAKGVDVSAVVDHEVARSIYLKDPNGLVIEYCCNVRKLTAADKVPHHHEQPGAMGVKDPVEREKLMNMLLKVNSKPGRGVA